MYLFIHLYVINGHVALLDSQKMPKVNFSFLFTLHVKKI